MAKKVKNTKLSKNGVKGGPLPETPFKSLTFDFSYKNWLKGISNGLFSNMLKQESEFTTCLFRIMYEVFPTVQSYWQEIKNKGCRTHPFPHCHPVARDKKDFAMDVIQEIHQTEIFDPENDESLSLWQLGIRQGLRVITAYSSTHNIMYPLFIDYHHQIHPNDYYNQEYIEKYSFCPVKHYSLS